MGCWLGVFFIFARLEWTISTAYVPCCADGFILNMTQYLKSEDNQISQDSQKLRFAQHVRKKFPACSPKSWLIVIKKVKTHQQNKSKQSKQMSIKRRVLNLPPDFRGVNMEDLWFNHRLWLLNMKGSKSPHRTKHSFQSHEAFQQNKKHDFSGANPQCWIHRKWAVSPNMKVKKHHL